MPTAKRLYVYILYDNGNFWKHNVLTAYKPVPENIHKLIQNQDIIQKSMGGQGDRDHVSQMEATEICDGII